MTKLYHIQLKMILGLFLLTTGFLCFAQTDSLVGKTPAWVKKIDVDYAYNYPADEVQDGRFNLLVDKQTRVREDAKTEYYLHYIDIVTNQIGVANNSQLNISYAPSYQTLLVHSVNVIRHNKVIDKLPSAKMQVIQREEEIDNLIHTGRHTLNIVLDDIRVGDAIELSFSRIGDNPVYDRLFSLSHYLNWSIPVGEVYYRLIWEKPTELYTKTQNSHVEFTK